MAVGAVPDLAPVDLAEVEAAVGPGAYGRGRSYAGTRVLRLDWDPDQEVLAARVVGNGSMYETWAYFDSDRTGEVEFLEGDCTCPVGFNCKHVAAIVLAAVHGGAPPRSRKASAASGTAPGRSATRTSARGPAAGTARTATAAPSPPPSTSGRAASSSSTRSSSPRPARRPPAPSWEAALTALLPAPPSVEPTGVALAVEVTLEPASGAPGATDPKLAARLLRRGRSGWVRSGVSWGELESWHVVRHELDEAHVRVARQIRDLHRASANRPGWYSSGSDKVIDLATLDRPLWGLLDEAARVGLRLVPAGTATSAGDIEPVVDADLCLDVTRSPTGGLKIRPVLRAADVEADVVPVGFLGLSGHGAVFVRRDDLPTAGDPDRAAGAPARAGAAVGVPVGAPARATDAAGDPAAGDSDAGPARGAFGLARLQRSTPEALRTLVRRGQALDVPAADVGRFAEELWPRLRHVAPVVSSDGSFVEPTISGPRLGLEARYGADHSLALSWWWTYEVGDRLQRAAVDDDPALSGFRDVEAEAEVVDSLGVDLLLALGTAGLRSEVTLTGLDTMRFSTEALPLLVGEPAVDVEVVGEPADFREVSDTLAIGVATHEVRGENDWFDLGITIEVDGRELGFAEVFVGLASGETHLLLPDGAYFSLDKPELQALRRLIDEARALDDRPPDALRISRYQVSWWDELCEIGVVGRQADAWAHQVTALRHVEEIAEADVPAAVTAELRPYQRDGFGWLSFLWEHRLGGILADDMGLGKTLQVLALVAHARALDPTLPPFLVVAPTSVVPNWASEAQRFVPGLSVATVNATLQRSGRTIDDVVTGADVVVTSYTLARLDADALGRVEWAGAFFDEAQHAKNHRSKVYGCLRQLPAPFKVAITGTPMENNLMELWALLSLTAPGLFPRPERFAEHYARPIERHADAERLAQLRRRIKPLVKRRTKELVAAELPAKQEQVVRVDLHPKHRKIYQTRLQRERQKVLGLLAEDFDRNRFTILRSITLLRQLSLHPVLVDEAHAAVPSAKIDLLVEQLGEVVAGGHRALVFSQFTTFLRLVRSRLDDAGVSYAYLDGRTRSRDAVVRRFKEGDAPAFLISLKAGGVGLNLTEADYCFLLDPWWNPATEDQAVDRSHRIGQTRTVMAYKLIATDTIEEKVQALKERKAELFRGVMDEGDVFGGKLDADDVRGLFT